MKPKCANPFAKNIISKASLVSFYCLLQFNNSKLLVKTLDYLKPIYFPPCLPITYLPTYLGPTYIPISLPTKTYLLP
jgi:hypothetical protein